MRHFVIFLTSILQQIFTYNGATGAWTNAARWLGGVSPTVGSLSTTVKVTSVSPTITLDTDTTLNQLQFSAASGTTTISTATAKTLTFDGVNPKITLTRAATITARIILNKSLAVNSTGNILLSIGAMTNNGKNITLTGTSSGIKFTLANNTGMVGGNIFVNSGLLEVGASGALNNTSGPTITLRNAGTAITRLWAASAGTFSNPIVFSDTGTQRTLLTLSVSSNPGTYTGSIAHDIWIDTGVIDGNWSGFSTSAKILVSSVTIATTSMAGTLQIGDTDDTSNSVTVNSSISNNWEIVGGTSTGVNSTISSSAGITMSGNILLNSNLGAASNNFLTLDGGGTYSGVISNSAAAASRFKVSSTTGQKFLTGINTYTSQTSITGGEFGVNGSIGSSSLITVAGATSILSGKGTVGPVTLTTSTAAIHAYSKGNSPAVTDVLTTTGNVIFSTTSKLHVFTSTTASSKLAVTGNVTFAAATALVIGAGSTALTSGNSAIVITYTGTSNFATIPLVPPAGYTLAENIGAKTITLTKT